MYSSVCEIHKFGGTSLGDADCFLKVQSIIETNINERINDTNNNNINIFGIVVSGMGGKPKVTDLLIDLVHAAKLNDRIKCDKIINIIKLKHYECIEKILSNEHINSIKNIIELDFKTINELLRTITIMQTYNNNIIEYIMGHGELWSANILTYLLNTTFNHSNIINNIKFHFIDARDILTVLPDIEHGPVIDWEQTNNKLKLKMNEIYNTLNICNDPTNNYNDKNNNTMIGLVITGFICRTTDNVATTLKRDGSDYSASIFGRLLKAKSITIWTDVNGVLSADPRRVPDARVLDKISYQEAMELSFFGAKVIHPKTMVPAIHERIPIYIRNTFDPANKGTCISNNENISDEWIAATIVSGFSTVDDLALFNLEGTGMVGVHGVCSRLFTALDHAKINVVLIAQASSEHSICFAVPLLRAEDAKNAIKSAFYKEIHLNIIDTIDYISPISIIAAVGDNMSKTPGVCGKFFGALGEAGINVLAISQGSSERNISAVVRYEDSGKALKAVHAAFAARSS